MIRNKKTKSNNKNWLKIWNQQGRNLNSSNINDIINANGHNSAFGQFNKKSWFEYIKSILKNIKIDKNSEILEYGCGAGAFLSYWYGKKYRLYGIDYSKLLIKKCKKFFPKINLKVGEISAIDNFNTKFSLILTHSIFQYFDNYHYAKSLILKMLSKLKPEGSICILDVPDKNKEKMFIKKLKKKIGNEKYKMKYAKNKHLFYKKIFFRDLAKKNNLEIKIFKHNSKYNENSEYRYNVIFKIKSN